MTEDARPYQILGHKLRNLLNQQAYRVGDRLPSERDIAQQFDVSRTVVREAMIMLEVQNLVDVRKGSGVYLKSDPNEVQEDKSASHDVGPFELLQARQLLESNITEFAASQVTPKDIQKMKAALKLEEEELAAKTEGYEGDELFHLAIAEATQNSVLVDLLKDSWRRRDNSVMWKKLHSHLIGLDYRQQWLVDHAAILSALQKKDAVLAKQAMWRHLENVKETLMALSNPDDPNFDGYLFNTSPVLINETAVSEGK